MGSPTLETQLQTSLPWRPLLPHVLMLAHRSSGSGHARALTALHGPGCSVLEGAADHGSPSPGTGLRVHVHEL